VRTLLVAVSVAVALAVSPGDAAAYNTWPAVDQLASDVAGKRVQIRCVTEDAWVADPNVTSPFELGYAIPSSSYAVLPPSICGPLVLLIADPNERTTIKGYAPSEGRALLVFLHESIHLSDPLDKLSEGETECRAYRLVRETAILIGASPQRANLLLRHAFVSHVSLPEEYRTVC
jgi:hypothetical protein